MMSPLGQSSSPRIMKLSSSDGRRDPTPKVETRLEIATAEWVDWYNCETAQASAGQGLTPGYN